MSEHIGNPPPWAVALVEKHAPGTSLRWRRSSAKPTTTAHYRGDDDRIVLTLGTESSEDSVRVILTHELAHVAADGHDAAFYDRWRRLLLVERLFDHAFAVLPRCGPALKRAARAAAEAA